MHGRLPEDILEYARSLRLHKTDAESLLWLLLRNRRMAGFKFRRQHPVGRFILDFYCREAALVVELDGGQHNVDETAADDAERTNTLLSNGIRVIRFWNHDVLQNTEAVLTSIYTALLEQTKQR